MLPYAPWLCWIIPAIGFAVTPLFARVNPKLSNHVAVASIGLSALFSLSMIPDVLAGSIIEWRFTWNTFEVGVLIDPLNVLMACVVSGIGLIVALFSVGYMRGEPSISRFWCLIQGFISGYMMIVISGNLLLTFIGWEIVGLCCIGLASFWYRNPQKAHIGLKTAMLLRVGDALLLAAILIIYAYAGTLNITELQQSGEWILELSRSGLLHITMFMLLGGAVGKAAQFPLHEWLGNMLVASPSCFNALTECLAGPFLLARVLPIFHSAYTAGVGELGFFFFAMAWIGVVTALLTALTATAQKNIFRVLAYSVSSIIGYMLVAIGLAGLMSDFRSGYLAGVFLMTVDAFVAGLLFLTAAFISYAADSDDLRSMGGVESSIAHRAMEVGVLAMIGIPPLSGFWCTNWIQTITLDLAGEASGKGQYMLMASSYGLFILLIITGGITAFYGLRMMGLVSGKRTHQSKVKEFRKVPKLMRNSLTIMLIVTAIVDFSVILLIPVFDRFFLPVLHRVFFEDVFAVIGYIIPSISTILSIGALAIGAYPAYKMYMVHKIDPGKLIEEHSSLKKMHKVLLNKCYVDTFYNIIAYQTIAVAKTLFNSFERGIDSLNYLIASDVVALASATYNKLEHGIDSLNYLIASDVASLSMKLRKIHTGVLSYNMLAALITILLIMVFMLLFGGFV